jgi:ribokinase
MGARTGFAGAVGNDAEGRFLLDEFRKCMVDTSGVAVLEGRTGIIIGFVDDAGERTLYPYPGANSLLSEKDVDTDYLESARMLHVTSFVGEKQFALQKKIAGSLSDTLLSFSPGDLYVKKGLAALMPFIRNSKVVFLNETEALSLTGEKYERAAETLLEAGAETIAVTLGNKGCYVTDGRTGRLIPARKVKAVDTTGAGDAFAAGFIFRLLEGASIIEAGRNGNRVAEGCVRSIGARTGYKAGH